MLKPETPKSAAVVIPDGPTVTYQDLGQQVERVAGALKVAGIERDRAVSIVLPNGLDFIVVFLAVVRAGAVAAPFNPKYTFDEFTFYMGDASSQFCILPAGDHAARQAARSMSIRTLDVTISDSSQVALKEADKIIKGSRDVEPPSLHQDALFLHTSGTTSRPKGVPLTHANVMASLANIRTTYSLSPLDTSMVVMPLFHVHGLIGAALSTLNSGGCLVVPPRFSASDFWQVSKATRSTWYSAVPTIHQILLNRAESEEAPSGIFRFIRSCSAALAPSVLQQLEMRFNSPVLEAYGMTEASHQMSSNPMPPSDRIAGTVGTATGVQIAIMDDNGQLVPQGTTSEVVIKGPNLMLGYRDNRKANAEAFKNGWFRTGDQGVLSSRGYLTLTGRLKELINRGGEKISPLEIDAVLLKHPSVAEAVTFGIPDDKYGEAVCAAVIIKGEADPEELRRHCADHLASFKVPDRVFISDRLPRTATGKIQRRHIASTFTVED